MDGKAVMERNIINAAIHGATAIDFKDALITLSHLDSVKVYGIKPRGV